MGSGEASQLSQVRKATVRLSKLQKQILVLALRNKRAENRGFNEKTGADVYYAEILHEVFGFPAKRNPRKWPCNRNFQPAVIGRRRYRTAMVVVSHSVLRLHIRGLVVSHHSKHSTWAGCSLTPHGVQIARELAREVNSSLS